MQFVLACNLVKYLKILRSVLVYLMEQRALVWILMCHLKQKNSVGLQPLRDLIFVDGIVNMISVLILNGLTVCLLCVICILPLVPMTLFLNTVQTSLLALVCVLVMMMLNMFWEAFLVPAG